ILQHQTLARHPHALGTGAASFSRLLGCAPKSLLGSDPATLLRRPRHRRSIVTEACWAGSNVTRSSPWQLPPARHGAFTTWMTELRKRNPPDGCDNDSDAVGNGGWEKRSCRCFPAQPNGVRLSCGALKKDSFLNVRAPPASSAC